MTQRRPPSGTTRPSPQTGTASIPIKSITVAMQPLCLRQMGASGMNSKPANHSARLDSMGFITFYGHQNLVTYSNKSRKDLCLKCLRGQCMIDNKYGKQIIACIGNVLHKVLCAQGLFGYPLKVLSRTLLHTVSTKGSKFHVPF